MSQRIGVCTANTIHGNAVENLLFILAELLGSPHLISDS